MGGRIGRLEGRAALESPYFNWPPQEAAGLLVRPKMLLRTSSGQPAVFASDMAFCIRENDFTSARES
jgi:hypothetical protein